MLVCSSFVHQSILASYKILAMASNTSFSTFLAFFIFFFLALASAQLSPTFYHTSCPGALYTIQGAVREAVAKERRMGASLLRLHFHDCFVNASVMARTHTQTLFFVSLNSYILQFS